MIEIIKNNVASKFKFIINKLVLSSFISQSQILFKKSKNSLQKTYSIHVTRRKQNAKKKFTSKNSRITQNKFELISSLNYKKVSIANIFHVYCDIDI